MVGIASPNPSFPQDVDVVTGTQEVTICGKNILPITLETLKTLNSSGWTWNNNVGSRNGLDFTINNDLTVKVNGTASANTYLDLTEQITLHNTTYTFSGTPSNGSGSTYRMQLVGDTSKYDNGSGNTFTLTEDTTYSKARIFVANGQNVSNIIFKPMLEASSTATTYEAYQSQTYTIHLGDIELAKIGDYQDYIYYDDTDDKWYKKANIGKIIYTGASSEEFGKTRDYVFNIELSNARYPASTSEPMLLYCNYYTNVPNGATWNNYDYLISNIPPNNRRLVFRNIDTKEISDFKDWLSTHHTIVYYVYNSVSSQDIEITDSTLLEDLNNIKENAMSYSGTTNISTSGNLPVIITASALKQLS